MGDALAVGLTTAMHRAGLPVSPERAAGLARALRLVPPVDRAALYWTCRAKVSETSGARDRTIAISRSRPGCSTQW